MTTTVEHYCGQFSNGEWFVAWKRLYRGVEIGGFHCGGFKTREAAEIVAGKLNREHS